ncbi:NAD(P)H-dependent oxidoreductase [Mucilaginibacter terrenus]|uniref:NAD(P)H-dependent oxidoreductase n=1 Tax=Mucilaginibacter terrenus TaxID=2482727 RepID=A0A3E2NP03_9SPHI|nr:NAD(P)H-dependent oxidoreductase [Mucilaginibacter terrenus]RFZ82718.1 NAD(P)H-dependent oxidoreductase [Mucilaginibacter terrenus]
MSLVDKLQWRYATKKYDPTKKLSAAQLEELLDAVQLSPSSIGLQHYKILVIENPEIRAKLREAGNNQSQITDASQLFVFAAITNLNEEYAKEHINLVAKTRKVNRDTLAGFENMITGAIKSQSADQLLVWAQKQAYIALGVLITAAADLGVDSTPMEGFNAAKFDEILGLAEKGLTSTVIAAVGFRAEDDAYSKLTKVRKPKNELFIHI